MLRSQARSNYSRVNSTSSRTPIARAPRRRYTVGQDITKTNSVLRDADGNIHQPSSIFKGKKVVLLGVPGAFTPVCTTKHVPSFVDSLDTLKELKVDTLACISVNDHYVMKAWADQMKVDKSKVLFLADADGSFTKQIGMDVNLSAGGLGHRSKRYSAIVEDGKITSENIEKSPADFNVCKPDVIQKQLKNLRV